jgi:hypothetical protein
MNILALDLGSTTGWALLTGDAVHSGISVFKNGRFEGGGMRFLRFRRWLVDVRASAVGEEIGAVYFEEVRRHMGVDAAHIYGGMLAILTSWCELHSIPYSGVPVGTIKKHATGKGNASKEEMIAWAQGKGWAPGDDNEADALAILDWGRKQG